MTLGDKISILADSAKYDASCSTSGSARRSDAGGIGNSALGGICHAWSSDGRCVSLLKVLLSNVCAYDCAYCVNRRSNDIRRTSFEPEELVKLILEFYRRNYIEGAFLSSAVIGNPDATMERLVAVARTLRTRERFNGYLHVKAIPGASAALVREAASLADRVSVNIELPSAASLARVAPDKTPQAIFIPMRELARASGFEPGLPRLPSARACAPMNGSGTAFRPSYAQIAREAAPSRFLGGDEGNGWGLPSVNPDAKGYFDAENRFRDSREGLLARESVCEARAARFRDPSSAVLPAGQTTQLVVGASPESDAQILELAENLYLAYDVRRVYYSAFIPAGGDPRLPVVDKPPLAREHRLYQADWLFRFYGFRASEILEEGRPFLDSSLDPKCAWALRHLDRFPLDIDSADYGELLRVPGIGPSSAKRILKSRKASRLGPEALSAMGVTMKRAKWFIESKGKPISAEAAKAVESPESLRALLADPIQGRGASGQLEFDFGGGYG